MKGKNIIIRNGGGYDFEDLLTWKPLNDNKGNPNARKARRKIRKTLARKCRRRLKKIHDYEYDN